MRMNILDCFCEVEDVVYTAQCFKYSLSFGGHSLLFLFIMLVCVSMYILFGATITITLLREDAPYGVLNSYEGDVNSNLKEDIKY